MTRSLFWVANCCWPGWLVVIIANCCIIRAWSLLRCASLAAICCIDALNMAVFASLAVVDCVMTDAVRLAMCELMDSTMVSAVPSFDASLSAVKPANQLLEAYPLPVAVMRPEARRRW